MKKCMMLLTAAGVLALAAGCSSLHSSSRSQLNGVSFTGDGQTVSHINASVGGWYFLWFPILTGSADQPGCLVFAKDTCNVTTATSMVTAQAKRLGATGTLNVVSTQSSSPFLPLPLLFSWKTTSVSGDAVR